MTLKHHVTPATAGLGAILIFCAGAVFAQSDTPAQPINCATADGDIRALNSELDHVNKQQALDIAAITPAGALIGLVTGTEQKRFEMLTGEYQQKLEARIAAIREKCK